MQNNNQLQRQLLIIRKVRSDNRREIYPRAADLIQYLEKRISGDLKRTSLSTLNRDIRDINAIFKIALYSDAALGGYCVSADDDSLIQMALESFEIASSVNVDGGMPEFIIAEKRKSKGTEHFFYLMHSISDKNLLSFTYEKFDSEAVTRPVVAPHAIKESKGRWYLIAKAKDETVLKAYALDRMSDLAATGEKFKKRIDISEIELKYADCFAMFTSDAAPEKVVLSFDQRDGNYVKSFPIHHSQHVAFSEDRVLVTLHIKITSDFQMELMSRAWSVEVLEPPNHYESGCVRFF